MSFYHGPTVVTNGLVLSLDAADRNSYSGSGTTWRDMSGNGNNLTTVNSPTFSSINGGYFSFNGSTQYANRAAPVSTLKNSMTMAAWINPANLSQLGMAVHNGHETGGGGSGWAFGVGNGNGSAGDKFQVLFNGRAWLDSGYTYPSANTWYYIVIARGFGFSNTTICYVNGTQTSNTTDLEPFTPTTQFSVGGPDPTWGTARFNGSVAVVQFYDIALSNAQILQNYNAQKSRFGL